MSTYGLRATQYERTSALAEKIARLVAQIASGTPASAQTRLQLAPVLERLGELLRPHAVAHITAADTVTYPSGALRRLRAHSIDGIAVAELIPGLVERLKKTTEPLQQTDLVVLKQLVGTVDREAAAARARVLRR